jgi:phosphate starvation-inducible PhoH-like protein
MEVYLPGKRIRAKTPGQMDYVRAIHEVDLTFCLGPAGTGKTYLAVAAAVSMLKASQVRKLVLVRPAVEAGEKLGFLPGTMQDKVNPYLRPLLDALHDMMEFEHIERFMAHDLIEIVPLAFMRGRTLNDALIILDEAQNTTRAQMLMFLTRLGHGSKMVVTGDTSQIDLEDRRDSGLIDAAHRLKRVKGVAFCTLAGNDIVRHSLVQRIVEAYGDETQTSG